MDNAVIYCRVSSVKGRQSTERQVTELTAYARKENFNLQQVFSENISGIKKNKERPVLEECISYCLANHTDIILISEISRLGRNTLEILKTMEILNDNKISIYIQNLNLYTLLPDKTINPVSSIIMTVVGELGKIEWNAISERLNSGRRLYIEKGGQVGRRTGSVMSEQEKRTKYKDVITLLKKNISIRNVAKISGFSISTIQRIKKDLL